MSRRQTPRTSQPSRTNRCLKIENLEGRQLMAGINIVNGVVTLFGTTGNDTGAVFHPDNNPNVLRAQLITPTKTYQQDFRASDVTHLQFTADAGHDKWYNNTNRTSYVWGGAGNDVLNGGSNSDTLLGQEGVDTLNGYGGADYLAGGPNNDTIYGGDAFDQIFGEDGADYLSGDEGGDWIFGGAGNDVIAGGTGTDRIEGNSDDDTIDGGSEGDWLYGNSGNDKLYGSSGADFLDGGEDNDKLDGGSDGSADQLVGGAGADVFIVETYLSGGVRKRRDTYQDFKSSERDSLVT